MLITNITQVNWACDVIKSPPCENRESAVRFTLNHPGERGVGIMDTSSGWELALSHGFFKGITRACLCKNTCEYLDFTRVKIKVPQCELSQITRVKNKGKMGVNKHNHTGFSRESHVFFPWRTRVNWACDVIKSPPCENQESAVWFTLNHPGETGVGNGDTSPGWELA